MGQFYTAPKFSQLLVEQLSISEPETILELGAGRGSLLQAASSRWKHAHLISVDIDKKNHEFLQEQYPGHLHVCADALSRDLTNQLGHYVGKVGAAVCNPPYLQPKWRKEFGSILEEAGLSDSILTIREASADLIFLAQNLRLLKSDGELGIIVPDSYITAEKYTKLRKTLIEQHTIRAVLQLPRRIYRGTDASTFILLIKKGKSEKNIIPLMSVNTDGNVSDVIHIDVSSAIMRMDYTFYQWSLKDRSKKIFPVEYLIRLGDISDIKRGTLNFTEAKKKDFPIFHTKNFKYIDIPKAYSVPIDLRPPKDKEAAHIIAKQGDILIARVGRNLHSQMTMISSGTVVVSDCIYRIRVDKNIRKKVWGILSSNQGRSWIKAHARGVCALSLTRSALENFPLENFEEIYDQ